MPARASNNRTHGLPPGGQRISGERPAQIKASGLQMVTVWVSFTIHKNGEEIKNE